MISRSGDGPRTHYGLPHSQLDQQPEDPAIREDLATRAFSLPGVAEEPSGISVPGARALILSPDVALGPPSAFMVGREFAHLHPGPDLSLHMTLPEQTAEEALAAGWGELHPLAREGRVPRTVVMVYAPRDRAELEAVWALVQASHDFARGSPEVQR
ncbi:MAG: luciferase family protein [Candidatus Dormibacteria bacterium]